MAAIGLSEEATRTEIKEFEASLPSIPRGAFAISCINSEQSVTISGPEGLVTSLTHHLTEKQLFARRLRVGVGYHSPQMLRIAPDYANLISELEPGDTEARPTMVSSVSGKAVNTPEVCNPSYWVSNMVSTVHFLTAVQFCCGGSSDTVTKSLDGRHLKNFRVDVWLEVGPHSALQGPLKQILKRSQLEGQICYTSALHRDQSALQSVLGALGYMHCQNVSINLARATSLTSPDGRTRAIPQRLPLYPFNHKTRYWEESPSNVDFRLRPFAKHDLVGVRTGDLSAAEARWKFIIKAEEMPWVKDHKIQGSIVYPAAGTIVMALEASKQLITTNNPTGFELTDVDFPAPIHIASNPSGVELHLHMSSSLKTGRPGDIDYSFRVLLHGADRSQTQVCSGRIRGDYERVASDVDAVNEEEHMLRSLQAEYHHAAESCNHTTPTPDMYARMRDGGLEYGPQFQTICDVRFDSNGRAVATLLAPPAGDVERGSSSYLVHPTTLDGLIQLGFPALNGSGEIRSMIPTHIGKLWIPISGFGDDRSESKQAYCRATHITERGAKFLTTVFDTLDAQPVIKIEELEMTVVANASEIRPTLQNAPFCCSHFAWMPDLDTMQHGEIEILCAASTALDSLKRYLACLVHKRPNLRFCALGSNTTPTTVAITETLVRPDVGSLFSEYVVAAKEASRLDEAGALFDENRRIRFRELDSLKVEPNTGELRREVYDVIITDVAHFATLEPTEGLAHIRELHAAGGKLILTNIIEKKSREIHSELPWDSFLRKNRYSGIEATFRSFPRDGGYPGTILISTASGEDFSASVPELTIVVLDKKSALQREIAADLCQKFGANPEAHTRTLAEVDASQECDGHHYVSIQDLREPLLLDISEHDFGKVKTVLSRAKSFIWVKQAHVTPDQAISDGLLRVSRHENSRVVLVSLALDMRKKRRSKDLADRIYTVFRQTQKHMDGEYEPEYAEESGRLCVNRLIPARRTDEHLFAAAKRPLTYTPVSDQPLRLHIRTPGVLSTLEWVEDETFRQPLGANEVKFQVRAIGVNFKDVLALLGRVSSENLGSEYAGIVTNVGSSVTCIKVGDRVATGFLDAFRTYGRVPQTDAWVLPDHVSFAEAASMPTAFRTAYYCLFEIARLQKGESILIHRASGATGQAAIQIAKKIGAVIYATVGSTAKKKMLVEQYGILAEHVLYSRDTSFADGIRRLTNGCGVEVVLNSLTGKLLEASWEVIAPWGRFVEIGLSDAFSRQKLPMVPFTRGVSFSSFNLGMFRPGPEHDRLMNRVWDLFRAGHIRPVHPLQVYPVEKVEAAFRFLHSGDSSGKLVIELDRNSVIPVRSVIIDSPKHIHADAAHPRRFLLASLSLVSAPTRPTRLLEGLGA